MKGVFYFTFYNIRKGQLKNFSCPYEVGLLKGGSHRIVLPFEALYMRVNSSNTIPKGCARQRYISAFFNLQVYKFVQLLGIILAMKYDSFKALSSYWRGKPDNDFQTINPNGMIDMIYILERVVISHV